MLNIRHHSNEGRMRSVRFTSKKCTVIEYFKSVLIAISSISRRALLVCVSPTPGLTCRFDSTSDNDLVHQITNINTQTLIRLVRWSTFVSCVRFRPKNSISDYNRTSVGQSPIFNNTPKLNLTRSYGGGLEPGGEFIVGVERRRRMIMKSSICREKRKDRTSHKSGTLPRAVLRALSALEKQRVCVCVAGAWNRGSNADHNA